MDLSSPISPLMALSRLVLIGGMAYFPIFLYEYSFLDQWSDSLMSRRTTNSASGPEIFDFIVVGSGSSGAVVANRLSEQFKVLLLEAGGEPNPLMSIPALASLFPAHPSVDWAFKTTPQKHSCLSLSNQQSFWPRGKALGGTSNLNFMAYIRGNPLDYDNWANITGDQRWSYENLLPYFKKSENYHPRENITSENTEKYHGFNGELNVEPSAWNPLAAYFLNAAQELGYPIQDLNAPYEEGFSEFYYTTKAGRRWGAYQAFLQPVAETRKDKLTIRKYSTVTKILFSSKTNTAIGVEYLKHSRVQKAYVSKEVILSAGSIGSPKLLLLSGIGPANHLRQIGIQQRVNLPGVGQNLQDHIIGLVGPFTIDQPMTFLIDRDNSPTHLFNFIQNGAGPLGSSGVLATGFMHSSQSKLKSWPDIQLILLSSSIHREGISLLSTIFNLQPNITEAYYSPVVGKDSFHIMSIASRPKSRGFIQLANDDLFEPPIIDPNYLSNPYDIEIILEGVKAALKMVENTTSFQSINAQLSSVPFPPCSHLSFKSDDYWKCYIRHYTLSVYHPAGTCSMGQHELNPNNVVLDSKLHVIGTRNLRVIDASVMPQLISSNPQAICTAIGELGSDFIKERWAKRASA